MYEDEVLDTSVKSINNSNILSVISSGNYIPKEISKIFTKKEARQELIQKIHNYYTDERDQRRKENWKRYVAFCKKNHLAKGSGSQTKFRNTKASGYIREMSIDSLKWLLKHIPTEDLSYFTSTGEEFKHTGRHFGSWLSQWFPKLST